MLRMQEKPEGERWVLEDDPELTSPGATEPPNFSCKTIRFPFPKLPGIGCLLLRTELLLAGSQTK